MKKVMTRAWEIAREGQNKFGGKVSEYLSVALKMAWGENNEVRVSWKNSQGVLIEMTVEHKTEKVVGYNQFLQQDTVKKVDEINITEFAIGGEKVNTWNARRIKDTIDMGAVEFKGRKVTITIDLPTDINKKVWGEYDMRVAKREKALAQHLENERKIDKSMGILGFGA